MNWISDFLLEEETFRARRVIDPLWVNFIALDKRLLKIWFSRVSSVRNSASSLSSTSSRNSNPFAWAWTPNCVSSFLKKERISTGRFSNSNRPASILLKSRISLIRIIICSEENFRISRWDFCSVRCCSCNKRLEAPMIPFRGVLSSWLILDKNLDLARDATSAFCLAFISSNWVILISDRSRMLIFQKCRLLSRKQTTLTNAKTVLSFLEVKESSPCQLFVLSTEL